MVKQDSICTVLQTISRGRKMMKKLYLAQYGNSMGLVVLFALLCFLSGTVSGVRAAELKLVDQGLFQEQKSGRMWQLERSRRFRTMEEVDTFLLGLNSGEYNDWRLPTKQELYELFVIFDFKENGEVEARMEGNYWYVGEYGQPLVGSWEEGDG